MPEKPFASAPSTTKDSPVAKLAGKLPKFILKYVLSFAPLLRAQTYITNLPRMLPMLGATGELTQYFRRELAARGMRNVESIFINMGKVKLHALYLPAQNDKLICAFHGIKGSWFDNPASSDEPVKMNGDTIYNRHYRLDILGECARDGYGFLAFTLPGFNPSGGKASEANFNKACEAFAELIFNDERFTKFKQNPEDIIVCGESLGGAVAAIFADKLTKKGMAPGVVSLIATFDSLVGMTRNAFPQFSMEELDGILTEKLYTIDRLKSLDPTKTCLHIVTVNGDSVIPKINSDNLLQGAKSTGLKIVHHEIGGDHTTWDKLSVISGNKQTLEARRSLMLEAAGVYAVDSLGELAK